MTMTIAGAFAHIQARPSAPVLLIDTCCFLDLFRADETLPPRAPHEEIRAAAGLLDLMNTPEAPHLIVPELVPHEYADHVNEIQARFARWTAFHDRSQEWLFETSLSVGLALPTPHRVHPHGLATLLRALGDNLLAKTIVLERDQACLDKAVHRLIHKLRPSHKKEMKDSMNLEQCLELGRRLQAAGFPKSRAWISSNTNDFAMPGSAQVHPDLHRDFTAAGLKYFASLRAASGHLRAGGEIP